MDDFDGPTFSLGIDLDDDEHTNHTDLVVDDSDSEPAADRAFKRNITRRRTRASSSAAPSPNPDHRLSFAANCNDEEEIEDFCSQDDHALRDPASAQYQAMCSTSKTSLPAQGSVVKSNRKLQSNYQNKVPHYQNNPKGGTSGVKIELPELTASPVRKFHLVDSDFEDFLDNQEVHSGSVKSDILLKTAKTSCGQIGKRSGKESSTASYQNDDLWNDFYSPKSFYISTPVLDEVCDEYFQTLKEKNDGKYPATDARISNNGKVTGKITDQIVQNHSGLHGPVPTARYYFFHDDMRIQNLVRRRLHNFFPLDILDIRGNDQLGASNIDYRSQFSHGGTSTSGKQPNQKSKVVHSSTKGCRKIKSMVEKVSQISESWVNPGVSASASIPKVAGQRRVRAEVSSNGGCPSSGGRWFTGSDGKRVYVSSSGQELTGKLAYLHYKKESGGLKKSRRKAAAKKK